MSVQVEAFSVLFIIILDTFYGVIVDYEVAHSASMAKCTLVFTFTTFVMNQVSVSSLPLPLKCECASIPE